MNDLFKQQRKSYMEAGEIYFWTATINKWLCLLEPDHFKEVIVSSLSYLSDQGKLDVFAFVIMPNHIHLIWREKEKNGKERSVGSFLKFTAHSFKKILKDEDIEHLTKYQVQDSNKSYEFWQKDPLAVRLYSSAVAYQKLDYIHANPLHERWKLSYDPCEYKYSTARYYELGIKEYDFIKDLREEF